jgi:hypothetical protein
MSQPGLDTPRQFQPPVAQRDVEAEVAHCVGGVLNPLLLNVALHGLAEAAGVAYVTSGKIAGDTRAGSPVLVRDADDMVALCHTRQEAEQADPVDRPPLLRQVLQVPAGPVGIR